jgi:hypothetical protein
MQRPNSYVQKGAPPCESARYFRAHRHRGSIPGDLKKVKQSCIRRLVFRFPPPESRPRAMGLVWA